MPLYIKKYLKEIVQDSIKVFHELTSWTDKDNKEYSLLIQIFDFK